MQQWVIIMVLKCRLEPQGHFDHTFDANGGAARKGPVGLSLDGGGLWLLSCFLTDSYCFNAHDPD